MSGAGGLDIWTFALAVYARPGVEAACLHLQDRRGLDVCVVLFALWAGSVCGARLTPAEMGRLAADARRWQDEVVGPLRTVRRRLKAGPPPAPSPATERLRTGLKALEVDAERLVLDRLAGLSGLAPDGGGGAGRVRTADAVRANLTLLLPDSGADDRAALETLVAATTA
ncbi:MAG TPA: TIGR02444 family protein [Azospirillaceae bacterium]|nr:TIGR02444 family protein [Azospirillaceae bacterium]